MAYNKRPRMGGPGDMGMQMGYGGDMGMAGMGMPYGGAPPPMMPMGGEPQGLGGDSGFERVFPCVKLRGLPFSVSEEDIRMFLVRGLDLFLLRGFQPAVSVSPAIT
jgi:hypothetical protein